MTTARRRRGDERDDGLETDHDNAAVQDLFRKHFEAKFVPLPDGDRKSEAAEDVNEISSSTDSEWEGLPEDEKQVEFVETTSIVRVQDGVDFEKKRSFMSFKAPDLPAPDDKTKDPKINDTTEDHEAGNLQKDLALQRLLQESHLLEEESLKSHSGRSHHKALDLRFQNLGSKVSTFAQAKMPLAQRRGILEKSAKKERNRRQEAFENGIILEKPTKRKDKVTKRQRGIGAPGVGRFHGGTLKLSRQDVAEIQGPKKAGSGKR